MSTILADDQASAVYHGRTTAPTKFERIELTPGPRNLPSWARGAHVNWMEGWGNSPELRVLCAHDPLAFDREENACRFIAPKTYISEKDGVASVHYHDGRVSEQSFTRKIGGTWDPSLPQLLDGKPWVDTAGLWPDQIANAKPKMGGHEHETYRMLATTVQSGYGGRAFEVRMHPDDPHHGGELIRLRGPWHGGAPEGFVEVYYFIPDPARDAFWIKRGTPWHKQGGYFGLYVRDTVLLDIMATFVPHIEWCWEERSYGRRLSPLRPETGLPKGHFVSAADCPGHRFGMGSSTKESAYDRCVFCGTKRGDA